MRNPFLGIAALALFPLPVLAQSAGADRIDAIERHIRQLEDELQRLKRELGDTRQELRQSQRETAQVRTQALQAHPEMPQRSAAATVMAKSAPIPPELPPTSAPHVVQTSQSRFGLESADGRNSIFLTGRLHFDVGNYFDYRPASAFAAVQNLHSGVNARRARLGVTGKFAGDWNYTLIYDFGGSSDGLPPTAGAPSSGIQTAQLTYNGLNKGPLLPLAFDLGYMSTPFTLGQATSSNDILLVERASSQVVAAGIFAGSSRSAFGVRSNDDRYWGGIYLTGPQSGASHNTGQQLGSFGRATYQVVQQPDASVHVGFDIGALLKPPAVNGVRAITLSDRPEDRVDPTAVLSTGALGTFANPLKNAAVYGVEGAASWRNFFVQGEYYQIEASREELATNSFGGGYIEGSWIMTGEQRTYLAATGAYTNPVPEHPFSPLDDLWGYGALELVGRFSTISLNDHFTPGIAPSAGSNAVGGGTQRVYGIGLNWYPSANIRFMLDFLHGDINKRFSMAAGGGVGGTPLGTSIGGRFDALVMRSQVAF